MVKIYLASSLRNFFVNRRLHDLLESLGFSCFLPQNDAFEDSLKGSEKGNHETSAKIRDLNAEGIRNADIVVAVAQNLGQDSCWECGFACGLGKPVIVIKTSEERIEETYMLFNSINCIVTVNSYQTNDLKKALNSFDFTSLVKVKKSA